jgi:hypothetical protein
LLIIIVLFYTNYIFHLFHLYFSTTTTPNKSLSLPLLRQIIPSSLVPKYLNSEWSFAQIRGIEGKSICCFDKKSNIIYVVCSDKSFIACPIEEGMYL